MKYIKLTLCIVLVYTTCLVKGQTEMEIKTTGKYLYSWSIEKNEATARENAKTGLLDTIFVSLLKEPSIDKTDTIFIKVIDYFVRKVGFKWQAIAFADKSDIKVKLEQRHLLKVIPVIIGTPSRMTSENKNLPDNELIKITNDKDLNYNIISNIKTGNLVLDALLVNRDADSMKKQILKFRNSQKLNFGAKSNYPDDSGCYIFVLNENKNEVVAVLDKGTGSRRNFLTNLIESNYADKFIGNRFIYVVIK